ncbi:hypothetical protein CVS28_00540 [Arthrobacter glacialis]|uniref:Uncharacterized protein n=1 Tax=Arthrobacter glacialis TaxID=1664 RepID=A0A2S4A0X8_ARTGL|nr:hypothetical protein CVS28_00540 [Arthrobacter glacialis]POH75133.1 hypothetical protein CVS27_00515 [Arthrobacter glacialis]
MLIAGLALLAVLLAWANAAESPDDWPARILAAAVVIAAPLTIQALKKRHQVRTLEQAEGSFER